MKAIRKDSEIQWDIFSNCHDGVGDVACKSLIEGLGSTKFRFIHYDEIKAGASIGEHEHTDTEEAYFLLSGKGVLIFDNEKYEMAPGDISLCTMGHSHGYEALEDSVLIVVG